MVVAIANDAKARQTESHGGEVADARPADIDVVGSVPDQQPTYWCSFYERGSPPSTVSALRRAVCHLL